ncbi:MAG: CBS domain-containing protein [Labilithrix sp.]|nr:CBS domain-containing protein [Labilithrix sp.]
MKKTAADVRTKDVATVDSDWPLDRLMTFLTDRAISGAPVVNAEGEPIGVVSLTDIARNGVTAEGAGEDATAYYAEGLARHVSREELGGFHADAGSATVVRDIMTPVVFAVEADATVQEVAETMATGRVHRVLVTRAGKMAGIISAMDLLPLVRDM